MKKYVVEEGSPSNYVGYEVVSRKLFNTREAAEQYYNKVIEDSYESKEEMESVRDDVSGNGFLAGYIDDWMDDENDVYVCYYDVDVVEESA